MSEKTDQAAAKGWLYQPGNQRKLWAALLALCVLLVGAEFFVHPHPHFGVDSVFGFMALLGGGACLGLILLAKGLGIGLQRKTDFYDD